MAQIINNISTPNDGLGDSLRKAFDQQNQMNTELYARNGSNILATNPSTLAQEPIDDILEIFPENLADENYITKIAANGSLINSKIRDDGTTVFIKGATAGDNNPNVVWTDSNGVEVARIDDRGSLRFSNTYLSGVVFPVNQGFKSNSSYLQFLINAFEDAFESKGIINYKADYSASYNARSLVDKAYVDSVASGGSITDVTLGTAINGFTADTPVDADTIAFSDLSDSNKAKKVSYAGLKSFFKSYFDTIYATISALSNYVPTTRTINGFDLTANRTLTTANVADSTDKRYQTENQKNFNDATSSIQTQLNAKVDKTTWTDYSATSVIVGFSAFTIKQIWYKIVEDTMFVYFRFQGTSNSVDLTFTTPSNNAFTDAVFQTVGYTVNNTTNTAIGSMLLIASTNVVILKPGKYDTSWTSSGIKGACGMLTFKI